MARPPANGNGTLSASPVELAEPPAPGPSTSALASLLSERAEQVLDGWVRAQISSGAYRSAQVSEADVRAESGALLDALRRSVAGAGFGDPKAPDSAELTRLLRVMSKDRARQGYTPTETAAAVFSLKDALGTALDDVYGGEPLRLAAEVRTMNGIVDGLGMLTFEAYVAGRDEVILGQQRTMLELSTPVVKLWDGIVAVPLIGTLDSGRTQMVMENLLQAIVDTGSQVAIIDITGVSMVDTLVAQHLLKTVAATRLMGADCIISGIRPQIAQTMVHLGVDLGEVTTKATLADAFLVALRRVGASLPGGTAGK
jgi:rsbT co-antagonist protein RsbR